MSLTPLYSVVVPTCGRVALFRETLACIAKQTYSRIELLVPDDSPQADDREQIRRAVEGFQAETGHSAKYIFSGARLYQAANTCLLYTSPSPRDGLLSRMPSSA